MPGNLVRTELAVEDSNDSSDQPAVLIVQAVLDEGVEDGRPSQMPSDDAAMDDDETAASKSQDDKTDQAEKTASSDEAEGTGSIHELKLYY